MATLLTGSEGETDGFRSDGAIRAAREILGRLFGPASERSFAVRLWNGVEENGNAASSSTFTLVLNRPGALRRMMIPPTQRRLAEAYLRNDVDIDGDLEAASGLIETVVRRRRTAADAARLLRLLLELPARDSAVGGVPRHRARRWFRGKHSRDRDADAVRFHYDAGNDFYALWLDRRMVYSCGYFPTGNEDLDAAQEAKLELICRKLRLEREERLLDIGCGWGGLITYAAQRYGARATGITLSPAQAELARARIAAAGLSERCRVDVLDYRELPSGIEFDKIASVGMVEHVGRANLPAYFRAAYRVLRPGGLFLNHGIVSLTAQRVPLLRRMGRYAARRRSSFIQRYVFPDSELLSPAENLAPAEAAGFETRDVESLREHYALTLRHWLRRLEARHDEAAALASEPTYRTWRLCFAGTAHAFATGRVGVIQTLLAKRRDGGAVSLPRTRADMASVGMDRD